MITAMDWLVEIEQRRMSLNRSGQERMAQLAYPEQKLTRPAKASAEKQAAPIKAATMHCCPETTA